MGTARRFSAFGNITFARSLGNLHGTSYGLLMGSGYHGEIPGDRVLKGDSANSWLDELLCEYVDGTMDRVVRSAFEECMTKDACLAQLVERLRCMRLLLCQHRCRAPRDLQARILERLQQEMVGAADPAPAPARSVVRAGSVVVALLVAGVLAGVSWLASPQRTASYPAYVSDTGIPSASMEVMGQPEYVYPAEVAAAGP